MSEQTRKKFDIEEQRANDVIAAIKTIVPLVSVIREWGKVAKELSSVRERLKELELNQETLNRSCEIISNNSVKSAIEEEISIQAKELELFSQRELQLSESYQELDNEIVAYREYMKYFSYVSDEIVDKVLELNSFEDKDEVLAMICLLNHIDNMFNKVYDERLCKVQKIFKKTIGEYATFHEQVVLGAGWNALLNYIIHH